MSTTADLACADTAADTAAQAAPAPWGQTDLAPRTLRNLMGAYPTGVAIVTMRTSDGRDVGLTINSFASLSLDPPLVLWSLVNHSPNLEAFRDCSHFAINVLADGHEELARRFATPAIADKFEGVAVAHAPEGLPVIGDALTVLVCEHDHCRTVGDHLLMVGRVVRTHHQPAAPLVFHAGRFTALQASS